MARRRNLAWNRRRAGCSVSLLISCVIVGGLMLRSMVQMPGESQRGPLPPADDELKRLADELRAEVTHLAVTIGERNVAYRPQQLAQTAEYLAAQFTAAGLAVRRQEYAVGRVPCCNVEATVPGANRADEVVLVGAHYDTAWGTGGANDNSSGVAALLALARRHAKSKPSRSLRFVAFVNEEPPFFYTSQMGSRVYARRCKTRGDKIVAMLCLETIGYFSDAPGSQQYPQPFGSFYPSMGNFIGFVGNYQSRDLVHAVVGSFRRHEPFPSEGGALPEAAGGVGLSDHSSFWHEGYPALMVTDTAMFRYPHYHEPQDTVDKVNFDRMARVVRGLGKVIGELAE